MHAAAGVWALLPQGALQAAARPLPALLAGWQWLTNCGCVAVPVWLCCCGVDVCSVTWLVGMFVGSVCLVWGLCMVLATVVPVHQAIPPVSRVQSPSASLPAQRYVLSKAQPLPLDIEYLLSDMWTLVGTASTERLATYEAAVAAVAEHERAEAAAMVRLLWAVNAARGCAVGFAPRPSRIGDVCGMRTLVLCNHRLSAAIHEHANPHAHTCAQASAPLDQGSDSDQERLAAALSSEDEDAPLGGSEPEEEEQAVGEEDEEGEVVLLEEAAPYVVNGWHAVHVYVLWAGLGSCVPVCGGAWLQPAQYARHEYCPP